jgi:hypothetical protein
MVAYLLASFIPGWVEDANPEVDGRNLWIPGSTLRAVPE